VTTIVVGVEDSFRAEDAIAFARDLALATEAEIMAVNAYPFDARTRHLPAGRDELLVEAERTLDRLCEPLSQLPVTQAAVADLRPARALRRAAERSNATVIVVGSSRAEFTGRVHPGSTGRQLLRDAPCAIAFAPQGYRMWPSNRCAADHVIAGAHDDPAELVDGAARPVIVTPPAACGKVLTRSAA
jgi:nucleotide-binding universal stress UspA family protein